MRPHILDVSAMIALFAGHQRLFELVEQAEREKAHLILPAVAVADANAEIKATFNAWASLLQATPCMLVADLNGHTAIELGQWMGELAARHALFEAQQVDGVVVTREPARYALGIVPLLVV